MSNINEEAAATFKRIKLSVDALEGDTAVLVDARQSAMVPRSWLPDGVKEGDQVAISLQIDREAGASLKERIRDLQSGRNSGDINL